jgi:hypothetical protein
VTRLTLRRPVLVRTSLVGQGINQLDAAHCQGHVLPWQKTLDELRSIAKLLAA